MKEFSKKKLIANKISYYSSAQSPDLFQVNAKIRAKWQKKNVQRTGILLLIYKLEVHG